MIFNDERTDLSKPVKSVSFRKVRGTYENNYRAKEYVLNICAQLASLNSVLFNYEQPSSLPLFREILFFGTLKEINTTGKL